MKTRALLLSAALLLSGCPQQLKYMDNRKGEGVLRPEFRKADYKSLALIDLLDARRSDVPSFEEKARRLAESLEQAKVAPKLLSSADIRRARQQNANIEPVLASFRRQFYLMEGNVTKLGPETMAVCKALGVDGLLLGKIYGWPHPRPDGLNWSKINVTFALILLDAKTGKSMWVASAEGGATSMFGSSLRPETLSDEQIANKIWAELVPLVVGEWPK